MKEKKLKKTERSMRMFGRDKKQKLFISLGDMARMCKQTKEATLSTASKLIAENKVIALSDYTGELVYMCRIPEILHYTSWELIQHLSDKYFSLIGEKKVSI